MRSICPSEGVFQPNPLFTIFVGGRTEAVQGKGRGRRPPTTPPSKLPSVRHDAGRRPWAERPKNRPPADASGERFEVVPLHPNSPLPPMAGLFFPAMNRLSTCAKGKLKVSGTFSPNTRVTPCLGGAYRPPLACISLGGAPGPPVCCPFRPFGPGVFRLAAPDGGRKRGCHDPAVPGVRSSAFTRVG